jgi:hypothetical protein
MRLCAAGVRRATVECSHSNFPARVNSTTELGTRLPLIIKSDADRPARSSAIHIRLRSEAWSYQNDLLQAEIGALNAVSGYGLRPD